MLHGCGWELKPHTCHIVLRNMVRSISGMASILCFDETIVLINGSFHLIAIDLLVYCDWSANFILGGVQMNTYTRSTYLHTIDVSFAIAAIISTIDTLTCFEDRKILKSSRSVVDYGPADTTHATPRLANV